MKSLKLGKVVIWNSGDLTKIPFILVVFCKGLFFHDNTAINLARSNSGMLGVFPTMILSPQASLGKRETKAKRKVISITRS